MFVILDEETYNAIKLFLKFHLSYKSQKLLIINALIISAFNYANNIDLSDQFHYLKNILKYRELNELFYQKFDYLIVLLRDIK